MWNLYKKELTSYLHSMLAYVFMAFFISAGGIYYSYYCLTYGMMDYGYYVLSSIVILLIIVVPILTMRLIAEEKKQKTDQLLITSPVKVSSIILGKYFAVETLFFMALAVTAVFPIISGLFGTMNYRELFTGFLGYFLMGSALIAIGLFVSSITENPVISAAISFAVVLFTFLAENAVQNIPSRPRYTIVFLIIIAIVIAWCYYVKTNNKIITGIIAMICLVGILAVYVLKPELYEDGVASIVAWFSVMARFNDFTGGILNLSSIVYYGSFIVVFLFLSVVAFKRESGKKGAMSATAVVILLAVVIVLNTVVTKANLTYDVTSDQIYSISEQTKKILKNLDQDVTITMLSSKTKANSTYQKILEQYAKSSDHVKLQYKDLEQYPNYAKEYLSDGETAVSDSVVVTSKEKGKYVSSNDFVTYSYDYTTYSQTSALNMEPVVTEAINYVTSEETPVIYQLTGHGEAELDSNLVSQLSKDNYELKELNLLTEETIPKDSKTLIINAPQKDFSEDAIKKIKQYVNKKDGKLYVTVDPLVGRLDNFYSFLESYGMTIEDGVVVEQDQGYYMQGAPTYLLPEYGSGDIVAPLQNQKLYVVMPVAGGITTKESKTYTLTELLNSTEKSYMKKDTQDDTLEKTKEDKDGPFALSVLVEKEENPKMIVSTCSNAMLEQVNNWSADGNLNFFMNGVNYLNDQESKVSVRAKTLTTEYGVYTEFARKVLSTASIYIIPAVILIIGIVVVLKRRKL